MEVFNLREIFASQFGYAPGLDIEIKPEDVLNQRSTGQDSQGQDRPYYAKDINGREVFMPTYLGDLFLPYTWMSVSMSKTIVETPLTQIIGGEVNEEIILQPYRFSLKGVLIGQNGKFPEADLAKLIDIIEKRESLVIKSVLSDMHLLTPAYNSNKVIIMDYNLAENPGVQHVRGFTLELKSDKEFTLEIE